MIPGIISRGVGREVFLSWLLLQAAGTPQRGHLWLRNAPQCKPTRGQRNRGTYPSVSIYFGWRLFSGTLMSRPFHPPYSWAEDIPAIGSLFRKGLRIFNQKQSVLMESRVLRRVHGQGVDNVCYIYTIVLRCNDVYFWIWIWSSVFIFTEYHLWRTLQALVLGRRAFPLYCIFRLST